MQGDLDSGRTPPLPPFVARPSRAEPLPPEARPLPPWSSTGHALQPAPLRPAPEPPAAVPAPETEPAAETPDLTDTEPWTFAPAEAGEPGPPATEEPEEPLVVLESEEIVLETRWSLELEPAEEGEEELAVWTLEAEDVVEVAPRAFDPASLVEQPADDPWAAPDEPADTGLPEAQSTPAIDDADLPEARPTGWADRLPGETPPLEVFPGEAEVWDAVATAGTGEAAADTDPRYARMADRLETFAGELRRHGADAIARGLARDRLSAALAGLIAAFERAEDD